MNDKKILSPISDYIFKLLFFDEKDKDEILRMLLVDCIGFDEKQVSEITLLDRTEDKEHREDKLIILDIKVKLSDGTFVNIEIQKFNKGNFIKRCGFYTFKVYSKQAIRGLDYSDLKLTISLNIVDFDLFKDDTSFYRSFYLEDTVNNVRLDDLVRLDFMELTKLNKNKTYNNDKRAQWAQFFSGKTEGDLDMIKQMNNSFDKPIEKLKLLSSDPRVLTQYEEEQKILSDQISWENHIKRTSKEIGKIEGFNDGIEQGIEQGIKQGIAIIASNLLKDDFPIEHVIKLTGLSEEEIHKLKK